MFDKLVLTGSQDGPHLLITAGVHGDEYEPMEALRRLHGILKEKREDLAGTVTLVPVVNKSAFRRGTRTGVDDKDLARICPGNSDGSESEKVAKALSDLIITANFYIDLHNGGQNHNIFPFAGYVLHPNQAIHERQRQLAKAFLLPIVWGTDPTLPGRTLSVARDANIPAIYTEIGGQGIYDETNMVLAVDGCVNVLRYLAMIPGTANKGEPNYHLEDYRPNSGYLQRLLPSPEEGFYIPHVTFGQRVATHEVIGYVQDDLGGKRTPVRADRDGIVFILRSVPAVKKGDPLGAILPVTEDNQMQSIYE